jgi:predicted dehydrogenase
MNRRSFIRTSAFGAAAYVSTTRFPYAEEFAGMKKRVGLIGTGWYGKCDLLRLLQVAPVDVVSLCDVDSVMLADAAAQVASRQISKKSPRTYRDYREMLKEKDLDLVLIASPDHWHALHAIEAMEAGADLYCQKPTSLDVAESLAMVATARRLGRVVQIGTQRRSTPHLMEAHRDIVKAGLLGTIGHVEIHCYYHMRAQGNPPDSMPPAHLDYDLWTGPAPLRPYNQMAHPRGWRAFMEYGNGIVGDMCVHMYDTVRWLLDLGAPSRVSSQGGIFVQKNSKANISDTQVATFEHPAFNVVWTHRTYGEAPDPKYPWGFTIYGDKGTLKGSVNGYDFTPLNKGGSPVSREVVMELEEFPEDKTEKDLEKHVAPAIRGHLKDLLRATETRGRPVADIEQGATSSIACILANVAMDLGRSLPWDAAHGTINGDDEAKSRLQRPYRSPWQHPATRGA